MKLSLQDTYVLGIDEVGRGPLAGPVTVVVCGILNKDLKYVQKSLLGITDSKQLSEKKREQYMLHIQDLRKEGVLHYAISHVSAQIIDRKGIQYAINIALERSLEKLNLQQSKNFIYLDGGLFAPEIYDQKTVVKGDQKIFHIAVASVIAKVLRDKKMVRYAKRYPEYGFEQHKGYGTAHHRDMIKKHGTCDIHRTSWIKI